MLGEGPQNLSLLRLPLPSRRPRFECTTACQLCLSPTFARRAELLISVATTV
jgi:hypothetical protein